MLKLDKNGRRIEYSGRESELKNITHGFIVDLVEVVMSVLLLVQHVPFAQEIARIIEFRYRVHVVRDGKYGGYNEDGTWNGMIGELLRGVRSQAFP